MPPRKTKTTKTSPKTKDASWKLTTIPLHSWMLFWALILATMALASVCFTAAFRPAENQADAEALAVFAAVKENLERQITELEGKVEETGTVPSGRILLDHTIQENCDLTWSTSTAEIYIPFIEPYTNVAMSLPYRFDWGNAQYVLTSADSDKNGTVAFGPAISMKPSTATDQFCTISRDAALYVVPRNSTLRELRESLDPETTTEVRQRTINGIPVLSYRDTASNEMIWIGAGRTYTYELVSHGWLTDAEAVKIIQSLRVER